MIIPLNIKSLPIHGCSETCEAGERKVGLCQFDNSTIQNLSAADPTTGESWSEFRRMAKADAAKNGLVIEDTVEFKRAFLRASLSYRSFAAYCGQCFRPIALFSSEIGLN
jgi:hypothetical protein